MSAGRAYSNGSNRFSSVSTTAVSLPSAGLAPAAMPESSSLRRRARSARIAAAYFALHGVRDGGDRHDLLLSPHVVVPKFRAGRELRHVRTHEHTRLLFGVVLIIRVVVPVKIGFGRRGEEPEKALLALGKGVEPRHDITPGLGKANPPPRMQSAAARCTMPL